MCMGRQKEVLGVSGKEHSDWFDRALMILLFRVAIKLTGAESEVFTTEISLRVILLTS